MPCQSTRWLPPGRSHYDGCGERVNRKCWLTRIIRGHDPIRNIPIAEREKGYVRYVSFVLPNPNEKLPTSSKRRDENPMVSSVVSSSVPVPSPRGRKQFPCRPIFSLLPPPPPERVVLPPLCLSLSCFVSNFVSIVVRSRNSLRLSVPCRGMDNWITTPSDINKSTHKHTNKKNNHHLRVVSSIVRTIRSLPAIAVFVILVAGVTEDAAPGPTKQQI